MAYLGLDPELARELSLVMREAGIEAEGLSSDTRAALTLSELESTVPEQLIFVGEDLDDVGVIVSARVDLAEGLVLDPVVLAQELGLSEAQVEEALAAFGDSGVNERKNITPFFELRERAEAGAEVLRGSFVDLPPFGLDPVLDEALEDLGLLLPDALVTGELDITLLTTAQLRALDVLAAALGLVAPPSEATSEIGTGTLGSTIGRIIGNEVFDSRITFALIANAFELDQRLAAAAGLPTIEDIIFQANLDFGFGIVFDESLARLDEFLPALLVGEGALPTDQADLALTVSFATQLGFTGTDFDGALAFLRGQRFLQRSLISGNFEGVDGPLLVWTEEGVNNALLAGRRNGVLNDVTREQAEFLAASILAGDGTGNPVELTDEQIQALAAIIIGQNGEEFLLENPQIQRQVISAANLIGRQATLEDQQRLFADAVEAFQSLAVVGAPAMTYRQLKAAVGPKVTNVLGYDYLAGRSAKATGKRPQFLSLLNHWGIPGGDTLKLKKRKFSFAFDESGEISNIRNKKLSKWKRFKNTIKALGKSLKQAWKDNPWGVIWSGVKIVAGAVLTVVPGTNALGAALLYASLAVLVADMAYQASKGNWTEALTSGFTALSGGAAYFGQTAATASTAAKVAKFANTGKKVLAAIEYGDDFIEAVEDGDILGALSSGAGALASGARAFPSAEAVGSTANVIATGAEFVGSGVDTVNAGIQVVDAIDDGDALRILSSSFNLISSGLTTAEKGGEFANSTSAFASGNVAYQSVIDGAGGDSIDAASKQKLEDRFTNRVFGSDTLGAFSTYAGYASDAATVTNVGASVIDGDIIGAAQQGVQFLGSQTGDEATKLAMAVADKGLGVAKIVENVYQGGAVPDGDDLFNSLFELGAAAGAAFAGPADPVEAPEPVRTVAADGSVLVDYNGDGITDAILSQDETDRGVVELDLDGDGETDVAFIDKNGDGQGDTEYVEPGPGETITDDRVVVRGIAPTGLGTDPNTIRNAGTEGLLAAGNAVTPNVAVFRTEDGVRIVGSDGSVETLTTAQIDNQISEAKRELRELDQSTSNGRVASRIGQERAEVEQNIARLQELRQTTPEGAESRAETIRLQIDALADTNLTSKERARFRQEFEGKLAALDRLGEISPDGRIVGHDGRARQLVSLRLDQLGPPALGETRADAAAAYANNAGDAVSAGIALVDEGTRLAGDAIPGIVPFAAGVAVEAFEAGHAAQYEGDVVRELVTGGAGVVAGGAAGLFGGPVVGLGVGFSAELAADELYDVYGPYEPQGTSFQLESGEIVTVGTTTTSGPPVGIPVSYQIVDNGESLQATVNVRVNDRDVALDADQVSRLVTANTAENYNDSLNELVDIFRENGPKRQRGAYRTDAVQALQSLEELTKGTSHLLPPEVVELFKQPF